MYAVPGPVKSRSTGTDRPVYATRMDLNAVRDFPVVAEHGSYAEARRVLGLPKSMLSRRIAALEQSLGVRLMERNSRRLRLTAEGDELRERAASLVTALADLEEQVRPGDAALRGRLRISVPPARPDRPRSHRRPFRGRAPWGGAGGRRGRQEGRPVAGGLRRGDPREPYAGQSVERTATRTQPGALGRGSFADRAGRVCGRGASEVQLASGRATRLGRRRRMEHRRGARGRAGAGD